MRVLVTGSRDWNNRIAIRKALLRLYDWQEPSEMTLVSGACPNGADMIAEQVAEALGWTIERHPADWRKGRSAGSVRNAHMVALGADFCLAFIRPCRNPQCRHLAPHASHGADHCSRAAIIAGIHTLIEREGW